MPVKNYWKRFEILIILKQKLYGFSHKIKNLISIVKTPLTIEKEKNEHRKNKDCLRNMNGKAFNE